MYFNIDFKNKYICSVLNTDKELKAEINAMNWYNKKDYQTIIKQLKKSGKTHFVTKHTNINMYTYCTYKYFIGNHSLKDFNGCRDYKRVLLNFKLKKLIKNENVTEGKNSEAR